MKHWLKQLIILILLGVGCFASVAGYGATNVKKNPIQVQITGAVGDPLKNINARLSEEINSLNPPVTGALIRQLKLTLPKSLLEAVQPYGYFKAKIYVNALNYQNGIWTGSIHINLGPRMRFSQISLQITGPGAEDKTFQKLYNKIPLQSGDYFDSVEYENIKQDLYDLAAARGYFKAKMMQSALIIDLPHYTARIILHFDTGPRYFFGPTHFSATPFKESFLRRFLNYHQGDYYHARELENTRTGLAGSNYFQQVVVTPQVAQATANRETPIDIQLIPQAQRQYTLGLGYGTDTGIRGAAGVNYHWVNAEGHQFDALIRGSQINNQFTTHYIIPGSQPARDQYVFNALAMSQNETTGKGNGVGGGFGYQTKLWGWQWTTAINYLHEHATYPTLANSPTVNTDSVYPSFQVARVRTNTPLNPDYGYSIILNGAAASKQVLSAASFAQARLDTKFLYTAFERTRFVTRFSVGATSVPQIVNLPLSLQFFAGGTSSIRGYGYNTIGPGRDLLVTSFEVQEKIVGNWYVAGFVDAGNVSDNVFNEPLKVGVGPGIVWRSPIGVLELTVANAISQSNHPWAIQFSMGPEL